MESSLSPIKTVQEIADAGRIEEAAARRAVEAKTARLKAVRLAKEEAELERLKKESDARAEGIIRSEIRGERRSKCEGGRHAKADRKS